MDGEVHTIPYLSVFSGRCSLSSHLGATPLHEKGTGRARLHGATDQEAVGLCGVAVYRWLRKVLCLSVRQLAIYLHACIALMMNEAASANTEDSSL